MQRTTMQHITSPPPSPVTVGYLGPEGTFSYFTGQAFVDDHMNHEMSHEAALCPHKNFAEIFQHVEKTPWALGIIPLENSLQGTVGLCFDLLLQHKVRIEGELFARISHCLISRETRLEAVTKVYSHPQPLAQCNGWLREHLGHVPVVPLESTAVAALHAAAEPGAAALGHWRLAHMYKLNTLANAVEDHADNWTRFAVIAGESTPQGLCNIRTPSTHAQGKSSLLFTLPDQPGALAKVLQCLAAANINMRKLESRPMPRQHSVTTGTHHEDNATPMGHWHYAFFADVECNMNDPHLTPCLTELQNLCSSFRMLGHYPLGARITAHMQAKRPD